MQEIMSLLYILLLGIISAAQVFCGFERRYAAEDRIVPAMNGLSAFIVILVFQE